MTGASEVQPPRRVALMVYPQVAITDVAGPMEPFGLANFLTGQRLYVQNTVSVDGKPVPVAGNFLRIEPTQSCDQITGVIDLLLLAGGPGYLSASEDAELLGWLRALEPRCRRMGAICTGSTVLLASGVLDGHRVATHWLEALRLSEDELTAASVDAEAIYLNSGKFWTSAGMLAGVDLALALIEADHGRQLSLDIARFMVMALRRQGGQSQFSSQLQAEVTEDTRIRRVQMHIWQDPCTTLSVCELANLAAMSERTLLRRFKHVTRTTLSRYIEDVRLSRARQLLETTRSDAQTVAEQSGFGTASNLRRVFRRRLGTSPMRYRTDFWLGAEEDGGPLRMDLDHVVSGRAVW